MLGGKIRALSESQKILSNFVDPKHGVLPYIVFLYFSSLLNYKFFR